MEYPGLVLRWKLSSCLFINFKICVYLKVSVTERQVETDIPSAVSLPAWPQRLVGGLARLKPAPGTPAGSPTHGGSGADSIHNVTSSMGCLALQGAASTLTPEAVCLTPPNSNFLPFPQWPSGSFHSLILPTTPTLHTSLWPMLISWKVCTFTPDLSECRWQWLCRGAQKA